MDKYLNVLSVRHFFILLSLCSCIFSRASDPDSLTSFDIPDTTHQVVVVTTASWTAKGGTLQRYEKVNGRWTKIGKDVPVAVGKNGLAWGRGLHKTTGMPEKKESDGKAPAGVFSLGTMFGYSDKTPSLTGYPYRQCTSRDYFIDDMNSRDYNQWVTIPASEQNNPEARWSSFERMKRGDHLYEYGVVILHNSMPVAKGKGSAIFFHVWRSPESPTLGCTSMSKESLLELIKWLEPEKKPLLIQVPYSELNKLQ